MTNYVVFDSSALVFRYQPAHKKPDAAKIQTHLTHLFNARAENSKQIIFQFPNICMAECSKAFAKLCYEDQLFGHAEKARVGYERMIGALLRDVTQDRIIHSFELKREHFQSIEDVFNDDYSLRAPKRQAQRLSGNDALIISMTTWLAHHHGDGLKNVTIITAESRMTYVCNEFRHKYPRAVNIRESDFIPRH